MKIKSLLALGLAVFALILVVDGSSTAQSATSGSDDAARIRIGFQIAPVPLHLRNKNTDLVGLGSYIVNGASACNDCHTAPPWVPGHNPHLGQPEQINTAVYLAGGVNFGVVVSRNITPDAHGLPASLTLAQFLDVMQTGVDLDNLHPQISHFLLVMPWPEFGKLTRHDLEAIYEYLSAIPHADNPAAPSGD